MEYHAFITPDNVNSWPLHRHPHWEIMYYLEGSGFMNVNSTKLPFKRNTVIAIPPGTLHGSHSSASFKNVSIGCNFSDILQFSSPISFLAEENSDGYKLAMMLLSNYGKNRPHCTSLLKAYAQYIAENANTAGSEIINMALESIKYTIMSSCTNADFKVSELLQSSGYAEDYIRAKFKQIYGVSPTAFVNKLRIEHALRLFEMYSFSLSIGEAALMCGFSDGIYFSRKFKEHVGMSPKLYCQKMKKML